MRCNAHHYSHPYAHSYYYRYSHPYPSVPILIPMPILIPNSIVIPTLILMTILILYLTQFNSVNQDNTRPNKLLFSILWVSLSTSFFPWPSLCSSLLLSLLSLYLIQFNSIKQENAKMNLGLSIRERQYRYCLW